MRCSYGRDQLLKRRHCRTRLGYRWTGDREEVYKGGKRMDDEWTGLGLYRALHRTSHSPHGLHELGAAATSTSPKSQATCASWHLRSVTIFEPLFPHSKLPGDQLLSIGYRRSVVYHWQDHWAPLCSVRKHNPVLPRRLLLGHQLTGKALHTLITIAPF